MNGKKNNGVHYIPTKQNPLLPNRQVLLIRGNGCDEWADCFSCPFKGGCVASYDSLKKHYTSVYFFTDGLNYSKEPI